MDSGMVITVETVCVDSAYECEVHGREPLELAELIDTSESVEEARMLSATIESMSGNMSRWWYGMAADTAFLRARAASSGSK
jgi:hypothetical protein